MFENGLESSASGYSADDFFGYFRSIDYELYDILGCGVDETLWNQPGPWYFVAMPRVRGHELLPLLWASALEELLTSPWAPREQVGPAPASFRPQSGSSPSAMVGHLDRVERLIRLSGWAGDVRAGQPARSLVISVDGTVVVTGHRPRTRYDVVAVTGQVSLVDSGFDVTLRTSGEQIEVHVETNDGTFVKLAGIV